ncbi:serine/threonine-protein kinase/endoribonuclease IRE1a-like [Chenopodium quinoa]|uniref:serine/threonine-protein kinase/endoribonuclease IRE1a-like n=1 Tax=Chenopodium quinoa TaxID=63459 RepID=UPI000B770C3E|nr:serine/threonine-protein kinase/endoribonuclease IRE1a-like [Chenopodium quinoa]
MKLRFESLIFFIVALSLSTVVVSSFSANELSLHRPAGRKPLSLAPTQDVELVAALNGTVYLIDSDSRKVLWSFLSGPPIYVSYHTPIQEDGEKDRAVRRSKYSFMDCGDDWELYLNYDYGKLKLEGTIQDYVNKTPIYEDDEVTIGSMHSTVFKVDPWSGRLIHDYGKSVSSKVPQWGAETSSAEGRSDLETYSSSSAKGSDVELYIERIDYSLSTKAFDKLLWNLTVGFFKAKVRCRGTDQLLDGALMNLDRKMGSGSDSLRTVSFPCEYEFPVRRFRKQSMFEYFVKLDGLPGSMNDRNMLPVGAPSQMLPSQHSDDKFSSTHKEGILLPTHGHLRPSREVLESNSGTHGRHDRLWILRRRYIPWYCVFLALLLIGFVYHKKSAVETGSIELDVESRLIPQPVSSKKKRSRKSVKNIAGLEEGLHYEKTVRCWPNLNSLLQGETDGHTIGKLFVSNREIAIGSNGTVVYEGAYEGRKVAVKRLVQAHHDVAFKEIQNLIASDCHPNIVRWYGMEHDHDFVYLSLEFCCCSLYDLIESYTDPSHHSMSIYDKSLRGRTEYKARLISVKATMQDIKLWKGNGYPSALLVKLMRDVVFGLVHLHELGIIHRDLKPQNVLINKEKSLCAKLSDMGISKRLPADMSSLGHHATGNGSSGWQAPEQLLHERQTRALDMFSLGCVLFYCVTGGRHPFGDRLERDINIIRNRVDFNLVEDMPEAHDLFSRLLQPNPQMRPIAPEVLHHPFFWNSEMRLSFLHDASDRVELEDREANSSILKDLESIAPTAIGTKWNIKLEPQFINDIGRYRRYKYESVRDLLRVIRNKLNHYRELPAEIQGLLGSVPDGFDEYFMNRFPRLLIEVYKVVSKFCRSEKWFQKYIQDSVL